MTPDLRVDHGEGGSQLVLLPTQGDGLGGAVEGGDLHRDLGGGQDLGQATAPGADHVLVLRLAHLHRHRLALAFLKQMATSVKMELF